MSKTGIPASNYEIIGTGVKFLSPVVFDMVFKKAIFDNKGYLPFTIIECLGIKAQRCGLKSLAGFPSTINGSFNVKANDLKNMEPVTDVMGDLDASNNIMTDIKFPNVRGDIDYSGNRLQHLHNFQKEVYGSLSLTDNCIKAITGVKIYHDLNISHNLLVNEPDVECLGSMVYENNPCNPADEFDKNLW